MAIYKVPQDVEAEDKLIGPFSFRQFIYLIVAALAIFLAYGLSRIFWGLAIIPAPVALFFLVVALPLKKDQPMETYLTAIVQFLLKPRVRLWDPEGELNIVEITAVKTQEGPTLKDFSGSEASERLHYLSQIVDTGGWASRGLTSPLDNLNISDTIVAEAQSAEDVFDTQGSVSQNLNTMIAESNQVRKQEMLQTMQASLQAPTLQDVQRATPVQANPVAAPALNPAPQQAPPQATVPSEPPTHLVYNPYPSAIHQKVISPEDDTPEPAVSPAQPPATKQAQAPSEEPVSPDIMRLATSKDLSISTIAREAERLHKKHLEEDEEVVISLR